jgi:acyl-CoA thioester hydrolase
MGIVYYANYFVWFEIGRVEFLRELGFHYKEMETEDDCFIPVVETNCRYKAPARYDEELLLETRILHMRSSVLKFGYRLLRPSADGSPAMLLAEGESVHVLVDRAMQKKALPPKYAAALRATL